MRRIDLYTSASCRPCKLLKPILNEFVEEENVDLNIIDLENMRQVFEEYDVMSTPTVIFYDTGTEYNRYSGMMTKDKIKQLFNSK